MANKAISELPQAQNVNNQDLFVLEQSGIAKKLTAETFITEQGIIDALAEALDGHGGIQSVTLSSVSGRIRTYRITFTDQSATTFQVYDGTSIDRISRTSSSGLDDVYTIFLSDGTTTFFTVHNGADGDVSEAMLNDALKDKAPAITETTESSAIATFSDGADDMPLHNILAEINPVQDLTYGAPYPAGGGKNLLPKGNSSTSSGITFTVADDGSVSVTGTSTATAFWGSRFTIPAGTYTFSGCPTNSLGIVCDIRNVIGGAGISGINAETGSGSTFTRTDALTAWFNIRIPSGVTVNNLVFYPQIETGSAKTSFAPYSNICPITGHTEVNVTRTGVNIWDEEWESGYIDASGVLTAYAPAIRSKNYCSCKPNTTYYLKRPAGMTGHGVAWYTADKQFINRITNTSIVTAPNDAYFFKMTLYNYKSDGRTEYLHDVSLNYPSTDTSYHSGHVLSLPISWQTEAGTVYGGTIDVATGLLTVTHGFVTISDFGNPSSGTSAGGLHWADTSTSFGATTSGNSWCSMLTRKDGNSGWGSTSPCYSINTTGSVRIYITETTKAAMESAYADLEIVYPLATPQTYQLTPQEVIKTLLGTNNVWTDVGNVSVTYPADTKMFIEKLTMPTEDDLVANQAITSGKYFMIGNSLYLALANIASGAQITIGTNAQRVSLADALNTINS